MDNPFVRQVNFHFVNVRHMLQRIDEYVWFVLLLIAVFLGIQPVVITLALFVVLMRTIIGQRNQRMLDDYLGVPQFNLLG